MVRPYTCMNADAHEKHKIAVITSGKSLFETTPPYILCISESQPNICLSHVCAEKKRSYSSQIYKMATPHAVITTLPTRMTILDMHVTNANFRLCIEGTSSLKATRRKRWRRRIVKSRTWPNHKMQKWRDFQQCSRKQRRK